MLHCSRSCPCRPFTSRPSNTGPARCAPAKSSVCKACLQSACTSMHCFSATASLPCSALWRGGCVRSFPGIRRPVATAERPDFRQIFTSELLSTAPLQRRQVAWGGYESNPRFDDRFGGPTNNERHDRQGIEYAH